MPYLSSTCALPTFLHAIVDQQPPVAAVQRLLAAQASDHLHVGPQLASHPPLLLPCRALAKRAPLRDARQNRDRESRLAHMAPQASPAVRPRQTLEETRCLLDVLPPRLGVAGRGAAKSLAEACVEVGENPVQVDEDLGDPRRAGVQFHDLMRLETQLEGIPDLPVVYVHARPQQNACKGSAAVARPGFRGARAVVVGPELHLPMGEVRVPVVAVVDLGSRL
mmetsp:Transcript_26908/g.67804  ORF Transcript_26908/g.67804 Transcript_26908/m.67804 type:complete len:222 (+) Transcript_26908:2352-3017(+)